MRSAGRIMKSAGRALTNPPKPRGNIGAAEASYVPNVIDPLNENSSAPQYRQLKTFDDVYGQYDVPVSVVIDGQDRLCAIFFDTEQVTELGDFFQIAGVDGEHPLEDLAFPLRLIYPVH